MDKLLAHHKANKSNTAGQLQGTHSYKSLQVLRAAKGWAKIGCRSPMWAGSTPSKPPLDSRHPYCTHSPATVPLSPKPPLTSVLPSSGSQPTWRPAAKTSSKCPAWPTSVT